MKMVKLLLLIEKQKSNIDGDKSSALIGDLNVICLPSITCVENIPNIYTTIIIITIMILIFVR